jgi:hypothetical protein
VSVYTAHDGAEVRDRSVTTDWLCIDVLRNVPIEPLEHYMHLTGLMNGADKFVSLQSSRYIRSDYTPELSQFNQDFNPRYINTLRGLGHEGSFAEGVRGRLPVGWCSWYGANIDCPRVRNLSLTF